MLVNRADHKYLRSDMAGKFKCSVCKGSACKGREVGGIISPPNQSGAWAEQQLLRYKYLAPTPFVSALLSRAITHTLFDRIAFIRRVGLKNSGSVEHEGK